MSDRAAGRNVHIYDPRDPNTILGGLIVTNTNFYSMVGITFIFTTDYTLRRGHNSGPTIKRDSHPLQKGNHFIVTAGSFTINSEPWLIRSNSLPTRPPTAEFINAVRNRDRGCVITGTPASNMHRGLFRGFQVTHIFPLAHEGFWAAHDYGHLMSDHPPVSIDSPQNGIWLRSDIRCHFESYTLAINPDVCMCDQWFSLIMFHLLISSLGQLQDRFL